MSNRDQEMRQYFAKHPWRYGVTKKPKSHPRFDSGLIKPSIRREA